ncbi:MAG TPA: UDP-N-acetylglucosamine 2-epimerase (non-hydrolyzing) [Syntrophales bacterium]|nr:UDP-N-acetylglucosamine 2-epimerase (non-hydrolyzing) [Syntrophales bacterium]
MNSDILQKPETTEKKLKILSVVGARPNFMKISAVADAIREHNEAKGAPEIASVIVHTGQHYDRRMSKLFFEDLRIPKPDYNLEVGSLSHARQTAEIMKRIEPVLIRENPDFVLVVGDVNSTVASALVAKKMGIRVVHVEAGLRSFDMSMPEEINRILTDAISDMLFITEKSAEKNLMREGADAGKIFFVGNVMIDTLLKHRAKAERSPILSDLKLTGPDGAGKITPYSVLTLHRPSNVDDPIRLGEIMNAIADISSRLEVVFPVHPRTAGKLQETDFHPVRGIRMIDPLGYLDFLKLMIEAKFVLTDSGGIQEETTALGVPCLTLRENTERPVTISEGTNRLVGLDNKKIIAAAEDILDRGAGRRGIPELWDGKAAMRIVESMSSFFLNASAGKYKES